MTPLAGGRPELPTHVLHVMNGAAGGAALTTRSLIRGLAREGIVSSVVCHAAGNAEERAALSAEVDGRIVFTPLYWWNRKTRAVWWRRPLIDARQLARTRLGRGSAAIVQRVAAEHGADLIHTNTFLTPEGGSAAGRLGLPHVWHLREMVGPGEPFRFWFEDRFFRRRLYSRASAVIANSTVAHERLLALDPAPTVPVHIVPNGVDLDPFLALDPPSRTRPSGRVVVGMVANLGSRWKRHELFVRAAALIDPTLAVELRIVGDDPTAGGTVPDEYVDGLRALVDTLGVADRVVFAGYEGDATVAFDGIDVLVHPAESESFGRIVVEAMAAARPVVGVAGGGVGELVVDGVTGLLAPVGDARALAAHIERLVRDPALARSLGGAGRERALARHTADAMTQGVLAVYREAMTHPLMPR